jgi:hypothetical protein
LTILQPKPPTIVPLPEEFLAWQVALRKATMEEHRGAPRAGVAPLVTVRRPGSTLDVSTHSIICGILPRPEDLERKTAEFRELYDRLTPSGAKAVSEAGIEYLRGYYTEPAAFDGDSVTTLVSQDSEIARALAAEPLCRLVFYVFDLIDRTPLGRLRCLELEAIAELHRDGPVFDNVWWHNTLFHGKVDGAVVIRFRHLASHDTAFGKWQKLG